MNKKRGGKLIRKEGELIKRKGLLFLLIIGRILFRCDLPTQGPIDYKQFIKRFQDRSDVGMTHKILNDPNHV